MPNVETVFDSVARLDGPEYGGRSCGFDSCAQRRIIVFFQIREVFPRCNR